MDTLSPRLLAIVDALPLREGMNVLEIGCGPGAMAREMARRIGPLGRVLGIDRSAKAIAQAVAASKEIAVGQLSFRQISGEDFRLQILEEPFDLAVAVRVGALDGRYPAIGVRMRAAIAKALKPGAKLYIDGGSPLREVTLL